MVAIYTFVKKNKIMCSNNKLNGAPGPHNREQTPESFMRALNGVDENDTEKVKMKGKRGRGEASCI